MAGVESSIVEEKSNEKPVDRQKVGFFINIIYSCTLYNKVNLLFPDLIHI